MTRCEGEVSEGLRAHFAAEERVGRLRHHERTREVQHSDEGFISVRWLHSLNR
mgnify:CR=1 FL=1